MYGVPENHANVAEVVPASSIHHPREGLGVAEFISVKGRRWSSPKNHSPALVVLWTRDGGIYLATFEQWLPRKGKNCILKHGKLHDESMTEIDYHPKRT